MNEIIIASKNSGKIKEFEQLFLNYDLKIKSLLDFNETMPDIEETGITFEENARLKAEGISELLNLPVIADDSGLIVDVLNGRPGVYSARYAGEPTNDERNNKKLLQELTGVNQQLRTARFITVLALAIPGEKTIFKTGYCEGEIAYEARGENGFGYDPIFLPNNYLVTMAELTSEQKNKISHRAAALGKLKTYIDENNLF